MKKKSEDLSEKKEWGRYIVGLSIKTLLCAIGYTLFVFGMWWAQPSEWLMQKYFGISGGAIYDLLITGLGYLIACGGMYWRIIRGGLFAGFNPSNYVVITTYSDGSTSSDYGEESNIADFFSMAIRLTFGLFLAGVATVLSVFGQWVYLIIMCFAGEDKAPAPVVLPIAIIGLAWFICAPFASIQAAPFFNPHKYDATVMTEAIADARNLMSANSYNYTVNVRHPKGNSKRKLRYNYEAKVVYNRARGTTTVEINPLKIEPYMEYFDKGKNSVLPGTYTFKDGELTEAAYPANRYVAGKTIGDTGIVEIKALLPETIIAQMEKQIIRQTAASLRERVKQTLWGKVTVNDTDISGYRNPHKPSGIESRATRKVGIYYQPFLHESQFASLEFFTLGGKRGLYDMTGPTGTGRRFWVDEITYN
jgi:hypothetical protein